MRKIYCFVGIILSLFLSCRSGDIKNGKTLTPLPEIFIEQGGSILSVAESKVELRKMPFSIIVKFKNPDSIMVNASFLSETFNNSLAEIPVNSLRGFKNPGIDEEPFNKNKCLYISKDAPNIWYYTNDSDHSFNKTEKIENYIICTREITSLVDYDSGGKEIEIGKLKEDSIYLVIISFDWNEDFTQIKEKGRKAIELKFIF